MVLVYIAVIIALAIWGLDRQLCLNDLKKDLGIMLADFETARDLAEGRVRVHYQATVVAIKTLYRNHFKD